MFLAGNLAFAVYAAILSFLDSLAARESLLFPRGIPLRQVFRYGYLSGICAGSSVIFRMLAVYSYGPALLFLQLLPFTCGFWGAQYAGKSLFGAFVPEEKNLMIWLFRFGISFLGATAGIIMAEICGKILGI